MTAVAVVAGVRTPFFVPPEGGIVPADLGHVCLREIADRMNLDPGSIDLTIAAGGGGVPDLAHQSARRAGFLPDIPSLTLTGAAAVGLDAVQVAVERIWGGRAGVVAVVAVDVPAPGGRNGDRWRVARSLEAQYRLSEETLDACVEESRERWREAAKDNRFVHEVMPYFVPPDFHDVLVLDPLGGTLAGGGMENRTHDAMPVAGAVGLLLMPLARARNDGFPVLGVVESYVAVGPPPGREGLGPAVAAGRALEDANLTLSDIHVLEYDESSAARLLAGREALASSAFATAELGRGQAIGEVPDDAINPNGGALAIGDAGPASGLRQILTGLLDLRRRQAERLLVAVGGTGGTSTAMVFSLQAPRDLAVQFAAEVLPADGYFGASADLPEKADPVERKPEPAAASPPERTVVRDAAGVPMENVGPAGFVVPDAPQTAGDILEALRKEGLDRLIPAADVASVPVTDIPSADPPGTRYRVFRGTLTREQVREAQLQKRSRGGRLAGILVEKGYLKPGAVPSSHLEEEPLRVDLSGFTPEQTLADRVPGAIASRYRILPVRWDEDVSVLTIAHDQPRNTTIVDDLVFILECDLRLVITPPSQMDNALRRTYAPRRADADETRGFLEDPNR